MNLEQLSRRSLLKQAALGVTTVAGAACYGTTFLR